MKRRDALIAIGAIAAVGGAGRARAWPVRTGRFAELPHGVDPAHPEAMELGGASRAGALIATIPENEPTVRWQRDTDPGGRSRPREPIVASDGTIFVATQRGIAGLGIGGEPRFEALIGPIDGSPALLPGDGVAAIVRSGRVVLLGRDGAVRAQEELAVGVSAAPLVLDDGSIVIAGTDRTVRRLDAALAERWRVQLATGSVHTPLRDGDRIAVTAGDVLAILTLDGEVERTIALGARAHGPPARGGDGTLWAPLIDGDVVAIEGRRRVRARASLGARFGSYERIAIAPDGSLRVPARRAGLRCFSAQGEPRWESPSEHAMDFPARADPRGWTLLADRAPRLSAIDPDGRVVWRARLPVPVWSGPVVTADGAIVVAGMRGELVVLG